ncbi:MAG: LysR family transcriptional regulator [Anaerofustis sp.]
MSLHHLRVFLAVADAQSISKAAERLMVSQPSVSQVIAELEKTYSTHLFDRIGRKIYITESGSYLQRYARQITDLYDEMERGITDCEERGVLRIGASLTVGSTVLPELISDLQAKMPALHSNVTVKNTADIEQMLLKNELDIALVEGYVHSSELTQHAVADDEVVLVCGKGHPMYQTTVASKEQIAGISVILREQGSGTRELFERTMSANELPWSVCWESADSDGIVAAAIHGLGVGVIAKRLVRREVEEGSLRILSVPGVNFVRRFSLIAHKNKYHSAPMLLFSDIAEKSFRS